MPAAPKVISAFRRRATIRRWLIVSAVLVAMAGIMPASAYWHSTGTGTTTVTTSSLAAPTGVAVPTTSDSTVPVTWTASAGTPAPDGYFVTRVTGGGDDPACDSSPAELITGTSCIDSAVADGDHAYLVTAVYRSWTATSTVSANVQVVSPAELAFTTTPTEVSAGTAVLPAVDVAVQSATGVTVPTAGIAVSLVIDANPSAGTLAGTTVALTDATGVATFAGLSIDKAGTAYTLTATSDGLVPATTAPFNIVPAAASVIAITSEPVAGEASWTADLGPVTIETRDDLGNVAPAPAGGITAALSSDSIGLTVFSLTPSGPPTTIVTIPEGESTASFYYGDTKAGTHTINLSSEGLSSASQTATISAGDAMYVKVGQQPSSTLTDTTIEPAVTALIVDEFGNQTTRTAMVTIAIADESRQAALAGTLTRQAEGGIAFFDDLSISVPDVDYTLELSSPGLGSAITKPFDIL